MEGDGCSAYTIPAVLPDVTARWQESVRTGEPFDMTFRSGAPTGEFRPFLTR